MNWPYRLAPAETLFDEFASTLAHRVTAMTRGAAVNRAATIAAYIARHMRRDLHLAACADEASRVVVLVDTHCDAGVWSANVG